MPLLLGATGFFLGKTSNVKERLLSGIDQITKSFIWDFKKSDIHCNGRTRPSPKLEAYVDLEDPKNVITKLCRQMTNSLCGKQTMGFTLECYRL